MDDLAGFLPDGTEGLEGAVGNERGLFLEFSKRGFQQFFAVVRLPFRNAPSAEVAICPERTTRVNKKDLVNAFDGSV